MMHFVRKRLHDDRWFGKPWSVYGQQGRMGSWVRISSQEYGSVFEFKDLQRKEASAGWRLAGVAINKRKDPERPFHVAYRFKRWSPLYGSHGG